MSRFDKRAHITGLYAHAATAAKREAASKQWTQKLKKVLISYEIRTFLRVDKPVSVILAPPMGELSAKLTERAGRRGQQPLRISFLTARCCWRGPCGCGCTG